jgi:2-polyprenyl-3-methyl-5-hydroxy-6-metoxy-1,4-benzoquinol methylase
MSETFDATYFNGKSKSNYANYEALNPAKHFRSVIAFIKNQNLRGRFLDVGCAFGLLLREVAPLFAEVYGCDISHYAISKAQQTIPDANLRVVNIEKTLPYPDETFDCITALDVLEHTTTLEQSLANVTQKLKKGGHLILSVPIHSVFRQLLGFLDKDTTHRSVLTASQIIRIVEKNRLRIVRRRHFLPFPVVYRIPYIPAEVELILRKGS